MFKDLSVSFVIAALIAFVGVVSVIAGIASPIAGIAALVVLAGGSIFLVETTIAKPLRAIATKIENVDQTDANLNAEAVNGFGKEIHELQQSVATVGSTLQKRLDEIETINAISQTITSSTLDYEKTVKAVLEAMQRVVDFDAAEVGVLRGGNLLVEAWWGKDSFKDTTGRKYRVGKGPTGTIAATKKPLFLPTIPAGEDLKRTMAIITGDSESDIAFESRAIEKDHQACDQLVLGDSFAHF